ncbi:MAG: hypothetical protein ABF329_09130, partial [Lentimonas sp.]
MNTPHASKNSGFALVIALSLMAFVLLLLLSITTLVQVETKNAKGSTSQSEARQNALLALNIAIGQLQKDTGPDQRTTALAALNDGSGADPITHPNWVGVYGNSSAANYSDNPDDIDPSAPALLNWLVSGNEGTEYDATTTGTEFGRITAAPTAIEYAPDAVTSDLTTATANSQLQIGGVDAKLLVGPNSTNAADTDQATANFVAAPLVNINTNNSTSGRYAWWVGDEGAKAKVNLRPSYLDQASSEQNEYQNFSFLTAQRSALEFVEYNDQGDTLGSDFDFTDPDNDLLLAKISDLDSLCFLGSGAENVFDKVTSERFHEITTYGHGVLADAYAGGLRKDLTSDFGGSSNRPPDSEKLFTPLDSNDNIPTWGQARSLINTSISGSVGSFSTDPILPSDSSNGVYPVFTAASLGVDFYITGPVIDPDDPNSAFYEFHVALVPLVALWNPHTVTINADDYELGMRIHEGISKHVKVWVDFDGTTADVLDLYTGNWESDFLTRENMLSFSLRTDDFAPGESHIYSLTTNGTTYSRSDTSSMAISDESVDNYLNHVTTTSENLRIPATVTFSPRRGTYIYTIPDIDVSVSNQRGSTTNPQSFDVILAKQGGIIDLVDQSGWYHAVLDARLGNRGESGVDLRSPSGMANKWLFKGGNGQYDSLNELVLTPGEVSGLNMSVYKLYNVMESRGSTATNGNRLGSMSFGNQSTSGRTRWLITGNPRARIVKNTDVENDKIVRGSLVFSSNHDVWDQPPLRNS